MVLAAACWMQAVQPLQMGADTAGGDAGGELPSPFATLAFQQLGPSVSGGGGGEDGTPLLLQAVDEEGNAAGGTMRLHIWREAGAAVGRTFGWRIGAGGDIGASAAGAASAVGNGTAEGATGGSGGWAEQAGVLSLGEAPGAGHGGDFRAVIGDESVRGSVFLKPPGPTDGPDTPVEVNLFVYGEQLRICLSDVATQASARAASTAAAAEGAKQLPVVSPMPGKIVQVFVSAGDQVQSGAPLIVLEAMKMEHTLYAAADATVGALHAAPGDVVAQKALLVTFSEK
mmetsp:Transcript_25712/g.81240  ORF Transcript_25712/g.81240 Transcript_25712/m.81240 type:complete len:285 (+) Transcript_25712:1867-2721(+)